MCPKAPANNLPLINQADANDDADEDNPHVQNNYVDHHKDDADDDNHGNVPRHQAVHPNAKTICTMKNQSTFYNPMAMDYIKEHLSNPDEATIATSNQLGRE